MFTQDWFSGNIPVWTHHLASFKDKPNLRVLEIGSFEGLSATWLCNNILTHPTSTLYCVDTWEGSAEHKDLPNLHQLKDRFQSNLHAQISSMKLIPVQGKSAVMLLTDPVLSKPESFDLIYVDGSHETPDVLMDAILSLQRLKTGAIGIFDDYGHGPVKVAVDAVLGLYPTKYQRLHEGWQLIIMKTASL